MKKYALLFFLMSFFGRSLFAMDYTLEDCIKIAQNNSHTARSAKSSHKSRNLHYDSFIAGYYPQLSLVGNGINYARDISPIVQQDGSELFRERNQLFSDVSLNISQVIPLTGAEISLSSGLSRSEVFGFNKQLYFSASPVQITLLQPLFKFNDIKWSKKIEDLQITQNDTKFFSDMEDIAANTAAVFFNLYLAQMNLKNAELNVAINDSLMRISKGRYNIGKIAENDLLQIELGLMNAQNDYDSQELSYKNALEELRIALDLDKSAEIKIIPPKSAPFVAINPDKAFSEALQNNPDVLDYKLNEMQAERNVAVAGNRNGFQADISLSYGLNQTASKLPEAYKNPLDREGLNLTFSLPIYQWGKGTSDYESALEAEKSTKNSMDLARKRFEQNIKYRAREFNLLQNQVISFAKADTIASRRFEVAKNRFLIGNIDLNTYFIAQNEKDAALRSYVGMLKSYWVSYYTLRKLTLYDFMSGEKIRYFTNIED